MTVCFDVSSVVSGFRVLLSRSDSAFDTCYPPPPQTFHRSSLRRYLGIRKILMSRGFFPSLVTFFCSFSSFTAEFLTWVMWYNFIFHKTWNLFDINVKELELLAIKTTEAKHLRQSYVFTVVYSEVPGMSASVNGIKGEIIDILVIPINFAKPPNIWNRTQQLLYREEKCHSCCKSLLPMPS